jgi:hypothetical protein
MEAGTGTLSACTESWYRYLLIIITISLQKTNSFRDTITLSLNRRLATRFLFHTVLVSEDVISTSPTGEV